MMRRILMVVALACVVTAAGADPQVTTLRGVVVKQVPGCEVDGRCSVLLRTDQGEKTVIWDQGERQPDADCIPGPAAAEASTLKPGDTVEIHIPAACKDVLAGEGASISILH